ncbi:RNA-guided endonuclease TnpB family protein [Nonomuraea sp. NPDC048882]|uniref:RNA-guided endonuclease InsQ/TnpB family protein n=1 Tax=Nonomuraea sp. NPDC048882 TaxID=3154347 RepID=UPI0034114F95
MSRYRLQPTPAQERVLLEHCGHARFVWNLAVEQHARWKPGCKGAPGFAEQCRQLTEARAEFAWLRAGSRRLARAQRGSSRRAKVKAAVARLKARETDRRKGWVEKTSTHLARRFDVIAVEDLKIVGMTRSAKGTLDAPGRNVRQKAGLNRGVLAAGWGRLVERLEHKAPGRVRTIDPCFTSQTCNACGHRAAESRQSQSRFRCLACGHQDNADVNAAQNIRDTAAGHAVAARGGSPLGGPVNREPQHDLLLVG